MKRLLRLTKKDKKALTRFGEYMLSGGAQFWSGYSAFALLDQVFGVTFWWAKSAAYFVGVVINYFLERFWVFGRRRISKKNIERTAAQFSGLMLVNFFLDLAIVGGLRELGITPYIGQFISSGFFTVWNWIMFNKIFAGRRQK